MRETPAFVRSFMASSNMEVMRRITLILSCLSVAVFVSTYTPLPVWEGRGDEILTSYRTLCAAMLVFDVLFGILCRRYLAEKSPAPARSERYTLLYVVGVVGVNLWITIADFATLGRYFLLIVALYMVFGLFFIPPLHALVCLGATGAVMLGGLASQGLLSPVQVIILIAYLVVVFAVSASNYAARVEAARVDDAIRSASRHDDLTGVLNRHAFDEDARELAGTHLFLLLADIDEFKHTNDLFGHAAGDLLIKHLASALVDAFGAGSVYRFGGDEFIAVFPADSQDELAERVDAVRAAFARATAREGQVGATMSAGCVHGVPATPEDLQDFLRVADMLLFRSKEEGRDRVSIAAWSRSLQHEALSWSVLGDIDQGSRDPQTGLLESDYFGRRVAEVAPVLLERGESIALVYFNVCDLKGYNARHGFEAGDVLVKDVGSALADAFEGRLLSHCGEGRYFLMTEEEGIAEAVGRACALVAGEVSGGDAELHAGVFRYADATLGVRDAMDCARMACESLSGRYDVSWCFYSPELGERMERRAAVLARFRSALEGGHIRPYYQPIVRSVSDMVSEFEVLARWVDPKIGMLSPADFIPALEEVHLIHLLDLEIVRGICRDIHALTELGLPVCPLSVNFSRYDFDAIDVADEVTRILDEHGIDHSLVRVEITESALDANDEAVGRALERFHTQGFQVWMDDFGSGYSSLNVLRDFDFDLVKFDMVFLRGMDAAVASDPSLIMLTNLVSMVKELGMQTLVEGVETLEQLTFLRDIACEKLQGYVFSRPVPFEELKAGLEKGTFVIEDARKRSYYDHIGSVNLMQPIEAGSAFDPKGIAEGVPCAVLEYSDGVVRYLEHNEAFRMRLAAAGISGALESEARLNASMQREGSRARDAFRRLSESEDWARVTFGTSRADLTGYARVIARVEGTDTFAAMFFAL